MSPRLFPEMDGLSWNADWLIHRVAECAAAIPLLSCSFPRQNIQTDTLERMTNEWGHCRYCLCLSAYMRCVQDACLRLVDRVDYIIQAWTTYNLSLKWSSVVVQQIGNSSCSTECMGSVLWQRANWCDHKTLFKALHASAMSSTVGFITFTASVRCICVLS